MDVCGYGYAINKPLYNKIESNQSKMLSVYTSAETEAQHAQNKLDEIEKGLNSFFNNNKTIITQALPRRSGKTRIMEDIVVRVFNEALFATIVYVTRGSYDSSYDFLSNVAKKCKMQSNFQHSSRTKRTRSTFKCGTNVVKVVRITSKSPVEKYKFTEPIILAEDVPGIGYCFDENPDLALVVQLGWSE